MDRLDLVAELLLKAGGHLPDRHPAIHVLPHPGTKGVEMHGDMGMLEMGHQIFLQKPA